jgi:TetR/AcrR family transcriptional regulator
MISLSSTEKVNEREDRCMNQKFFDLKKEKQDRIINAAMKHFYLQGFKRASTDDMVKDANISKGLLFHYFLSKKGLYQFLCDYALRYYFLEVKSMIQIERKDYFAS